MIETAQQPEIPKEGTLMFSRRSRRMAAIVAGAATVLGLCPLGHRADAAVSYAGANLPWIAYGHSFGDDGLHGYSASYNSSTVQSAMDDLKSKHLNICRVFIFDDLEGVIANGNLNTIITPSSTYINNLTDFVTRANNDGITVYATMFNAWDFVSWPSTYKINPTTIFNNSALYSSSGPIQTIGRALAGKNVIWDFMNEGNNLAQYYNNGWQDLAGWVNMNSWISQTKSALRAGRSTGNFTITLNDPNVLKYQSGTSNSSDTLNRSNLDFYDCHFYNDTGSIGYSTSTFGDGKPCFVGEFGPGSQDWASTSDNPVTLVDNFWNSAVSNGISGLLIWSYLDDGNGNKTQGTSELTELGNKAAAAGIGGGGTTSPPAAPTNLSATAGNSQATLSWTGSTGATSYNVYRATSSGGEGSTPITTGLTGTSYTNTGLTNGTTYYYKVAAVNSGGTSTQSNEASATPVSSTTASIIYDFENSLNGWSGSNLYGGPWSVTEWAASGSYSLKADVTLSSGGVYYLNNQQGNNFSGKSKLTATVRHASWGTYSGGMTAKLYIQVGSGWTWYDGGPVSIDSSTSGTVLTLNLSGISSLDQIKAVGIQYTAGSGDSGQSSVYVDKVTLQ
jgi:hypothetical protein